MVRERDGAYEMPPSTKPEVWTDVAWEADGIQDIEDLEGSGAWAEAWRVYRGSEILTYFVSESEFSPEARRALADVYDLLLRLAREGRETEESPECVSQKPPCSSDARGEENWEW